MEGVPECAVDDELAEEHVAGCNGAACGAAQGTRVEGHELEAAAVEAVVVGHGGILVGRLALIGDEIAAVARGPDVVDGAVGVLLIPDIELLVVVVDTRMLEIVADGVGHGDGGRQKGHLILARPLAVLRRDGIDDGALAEVVDGAAGGLYRGALSDLESGRHARQVGRAAHDELDGRLLGIDANQRVAGLEEDFIGTVDADSGLQHVALGIERLVLEAGGQQACSCHQADHCPVMQKCHFVIAYDSF